MQSSANIPSGILNSLREIVQGLRVSSHETTTKFRISGAQLFVLQKVHESKSAVSIGEIAAMTLTHISSVSVVVHKLHKRGLLQKTHAQDDRRKFLISLTERGRKLLLNPPMTAQQSLIDSVNSLTKKDQVKLAQLLDRVTTKAGLKLGKVPMFFEEVIIPTKKKIPTLRAKRPR